MHRSNAVNRILFLFVADMLLTQFALWIAGVARVILPYGQTLTTQDFQLQPVAVTVGAIWAFILPLLSVYDERRNRRLSDELQNVLLAVGVAALVLAGGLYLSFRELPRLLFIYFALLDAVLLVTARVLVSAFLTLRNVQTGGQTHVIIAGAGKVGQQVARRIATQPWLQSRLIGFVDDDPAKIGRTFEGAPVLGPLADINKVVREQQIDQVLVALPMRAHDALEQLVNSLQDQPVTVHVVPDLFELAFFKATVEDFYGIPLIGLRDPAIDGFNRILKRAFDVTLSVAILALIWPIMLLIAAVIKLTSPGPAMFKQKRVGENGRLFWIYKFRSMVPDAESRLREVWRPEDGPHGWHKRADDPRITPVGHFLRRTSLDELPQLFNVLRGEMSLVGPRPELPILVEQYEAWQRKRLCVPPGITGWWQISGRSERMMHLHTEDDLYYIQHYSPLLDLLILWRTVGVVFRGRGAY